MLRDIKRDQGGEWRKRQRQEVVIEPLEAMTKDPQYLGARRIVSDITDWISVAEVPWWRPDLRIEEDLIEEIARMIGYDQVPTTLPPGSQSS